ncbi:serine protease 1-like [Drosophila sulfurigaster albostrigata]|uniref:serine protease 1-like n=1 Tax=Drosophila sulfurigaster albostrigata TaxID=89887 RepID=UPI002D21E4DE|nr:serine protease 1-like [Drosophila sulfurigaster albostrigata]
MQVLLVFLFVIIALSLGAKLPLSGTQHLNIHQRIQKGKIAHKGQFPYIVSLAISKDLRISRCGGSIIDHNWILTAAHCTHNADWIKIFYGSTKNVQGEFSHEVGSDNIIQHEHFDHDTGVNDIALIRTPHVEYSELVNKVSVADLDNDFEGAWAVASGWGKNEYGIPQEDLLFVGLQIYSKKLWLEFVGELSDTIICGRNSDGVPTGEGDSGGPLVTRDAPKLIGVTSFAIEGYYTCFTRVSAYLNWIRDHIVLK